ncbi:MAG: hypothetical protein PHQ23_03305, partial [Candidatus Wallbacteria bacterium]|nr:hypothetical protein [Candidatus Wallbacteria bacterium]
MRNQQYLFLAVVFFLASLCSAENPFGSFQIGCNVAWFEGAYDHDFGVNPLHPDWGVSFDAGKYRQTLDGLAEKGAKLLRVWAFEEEEGWTLDGDAIAGLDQDFS